MLLAARHECEHHDESHARRLKTWLGLRYDRPAVPQEYVALAKELAKRLRKRSHRQAEERVRDILATFDTAADGTVEFTLTAVVPREEAAADPNLVDRTRDWLSKIALAVPAALGLSVDIIAATDEQVSLAFLESAFSLDLSTISWPNTEPGPVGAVG